MKNSNYYTRKQFENALNQERNREVPIVNVRTRVRMALNEELRAQNQNTIDVGINTLVEWFSGVKGFVATSVMVASMVAFGFFAFSQLSDLNLDTSDDEVVAFINDGDWSEF